MHSDSMPPLRQRGGTCYAARPSASSRFSVRFWGRRRPRELMVENRALYARIGYVEYDRRIVNGFPRAFCRKALGYLES